MLIGIRDLNRYGKKTLKQAREMVLRVFSKSDLVPSALVSRVLGIDPRSLGSIPEGR